MADPRLPGMCFDIDSSSLCGLRSDVQRRFADTRRRFASTEMKVRDADIDFELARSYVNTGQIDRAEPLFLRACDEGEPTAEVTVELANLALNAVLAKRCANLT